MTNEFAPRKNPYTIGQPWWLYMLECKGGGIYIGIALDVDQRFEQHASGKGAQYTRLNPPLRMRIPGQAGHGFHGNLDSDSSGSWTVIPRQAGQLKEVA